MKDPISYGFMIIIATLLITIIWSLISTSIESTKFQYTASQSGWNGGTIFFDSYEIKGECLYTDKGETMCGDYKIQKK